MRFGDRKRPAGYQVAYVIRGLNNMRVSGRPECPMCDKERTSTHHVSECSVRGYPRDFDCCAACLVRLLVVVRDSR